MASSTAKLGEELKAVEAVAEFKVFLKKHEELQDHREKAREKQDKKEEEKDTNAINALLKNTSRDTMTEGFTKLQNAGITDRVIETLLRNGLNVKMIDNFVGNEEKKHLGFQFTAIIAASKKRWTKIQDQKANRTIIYRSAKRKKITRTVKSQRGSMDNSTVLSKKTSYTTIYSITMNVNLYMSGIGLLTDPELSYQNPNYRFGDNQCTVSMWWIENQPLHWASPSKITVTEEQLKNYQNDCMVRGVPAQQNEILSKVPLIAVLGFLISSTEKESTFPDRLGALYAKLVFVKYCLEEYPQFAQLWRELPIYFLNKYTTPIPDLKVLATKPESYIGLKKYTLAKQVEDILTYEEGLPSDISRLFIEKIRTSVPGETYPEAYFASLRLAMAKKENSSKSILDENILVAAQKEYPHFPFNSEQMNILDDLKIPTLTVKRDFSTTFFKLTERRKFVLLHDKEIFDLFFKHYQSTTDAIKDHLLKLINEEKSAVHRGHFLLNLLSWGQHNIFQWLMQRIKSVNVSVVLPADGNGFLHFLLMQTEPDGILIDEISQEEGVSFARNLQGKTPVDIAFEEKHLDVIPLWISKNEGLDNGVLEQILHHAIQRDAFDIIQKMIDSNMKNLCLSDEDASHLFKKNANLLMKLSLICMPSSIVRLIAREKIDYFNNFFLCHKGQVNSFICYTMFKEFLINDQYDIAEFLLKNKLKLSEYVDSSVFNYLVKQTRINKNQRSRFIQTLFIYGQAIEEKSCIVKELNGLIENEIDLVKEIFAVSLRKFSDNLLLQYLILFFQKCEYELAFFILKNRPTIVNNQEDVVFSKFLENVEEKSEGAVYMRDILSQINQVGLRSVSLLLEKNRLGLLRELVTNYAEKFNAGIDEILWDCVRSCRSIAEVMGLLNQLESKELDCLRALLKPAGQYHLYVWQGKPVSEQWIKIVTIAKKMIVQLARQASSLTLDPDVLLFLQKPTVKTSTSLFEIPEEIQQLVEEYQKLCVAKKPLSSLIIGGR